MLGAIATRRAFPSGAAEGGDAEWSGVSFAEGRTSTRNSSWILRQSSLPASLREGMVRSGLLRDARNRRALPPNRANWPMLMRRIHAKADREPYINWRPMVAQCIGCSAGLQRKPATAGECPSNTCQLKLHQTTHVSAAAV